MFLVLELSAKLGLGPYSIKLMNLVLQLKICELSPSSHLNLTFSDSF